MHFTKLRTEYWIASQAWMPTNKVAMWSLWTRKHTAISKTRVVTTESVWTWWCHSSSQSSKNRGDGWTWTILLCSGYYSYSRYDRWLDPLEQFVILQLYDRTSLQSRTDSHVSSYSPRKVKQLMLHYQLFFNTQRGQSIKVDTGHCWDGW